MPSNGISSSTNILSDLGSMPNAPYPPYPPNVEIVTTIGGYSRTCLVVDLCTPEPLTKAQIAQIEDQIGLTLEKSNLTGRSDVVGPDRFIVPLRSALRLG